MKTKIYHWYNALAATLLSLLGFSCSSSDNKFEAILLYGTPTTTYHFNGKVTAEDGTPIQGIKVVNHNYALRCDSTYTDANGNFQTQKQSSTGSIQHMLEHDELMLTFEDVDGEANGGVFANDTVHGKEMTNYRQTEKSQDNSWDLGTYEITVNKTLKKK